ncbi:MAG TPA: GntR family transcriptional regulator [Bryobacteraceae bacterium]|nr:GntR family transcriptional regulator [Bryobacteraceae bacterium]
MKPTAFTIRLEGGSGVPVYRQIIDQVMGGVAAGALSGGAQLPTVRQLAVDLAVNPNTVMRAYRELELRGVVETQQGVGTYVTAQRVERDEVARQARLGRLAADTAARAGAEGFSLQELIERLAEMTAGGGESQETKKKENGDV